MATKYLLIPEDLYNNLLKSQQNNVIGTEFASNNLSKVKKSKNKNASAKNVLYNQELRRYLKTKKEEEEKPIKVEVSNGLKGLTKKNPPVITNSPVSSIETPIQPRISYPLQIINEEDEDKQNENFEGDFEPQTFSAKFLNKSYHETPKTTNMYHTRLERMMKIINENPDAFQVRDNRILNKFGNYILKSNVLESVNHILNVSSEILLARRRERQIYCQNYKHILLQEKFYLRNGQSNHLIGFTDDGKSKKINKVKEL